MEEWMPPQQWLESLDLQTRAKADRLIAILERFGANNPVSWVSSEMRENIPQVARFLFLHEVRSQLINKFNYRRILDEDEANLHPEEIEMKGDEAHNRLLNAGANPDDLERVARAAACMAVQEFIGLLDGLLESEAEDIEDAPRWILAEVAGPIGQAKLSGRCLDGLHESFYSLYQTDP